MRLRPTNDTASQTPSAEELLAQDLQRRGLTAAQIEAAGMSLEASARALNPKWPNVPAIFIPYYTAAGEEIVSANDSDAVYFRVRLLGELPKGFTSKKATRYRQEPHSGVRAYFARVAGLSWPDILSNPQ